MTSYKICGSGLANSGKKNMAFEINKEIEREFCTIGSYFNNNKLKFQY